MPGLNCATFTPRANFITSWHLRKTREPEENLFGRWGRQLLPKGKPQTWNARAVRQHCLLTPRGRFAYLVHLYDIGMFILRS